MEEETWPKRADADELVSAGAEAELDDLGVSCAATWPHVVVGDPSGEPVGVVPRRLDAVAVGGSAHVDA